jgi:ribonuclease Z
MENFHLQILGCGSALPTRIHNQSSQILTIRDKIFMIDCGEGTQKQIRNYNVKISRLNHIFISHLHGDHCFGLIGLITTLGLLGRTADLHIHAYKDLEKNLLQPVISYFCKGMPYSIYFHSFNPRQHTLLYDDRSLSVFSIPLKHKVPSSGFLFVEKERERSIRKEMIDFYKIPVKEIQYIKKGADFITEDGMVIPNERLTSCPCYPKKYAYCSDTMYSEKIIPYIENIDCLYHEATFMQIHKERAQETMHSTAIDAATIASKANVKQLIIGHYSARYDDMSELLSEARTVFENTHLSEEGKIFEF